MLRRITVHFLQAILSCLLSFIVSNSSACVLSQGQFGLLLQKLNNILLLIGSSEGSYAQAANSPYTDQSNTFCNQYPASPFCYQEYLSVAERNVSVTEESKSQSKSIMDVIKSTECWINGYYCQPDATNLITSIKLDTPKECKDKCEERYQSNVFRFHHIHGQVLCSLLNNCSKATDCPPEKNCATGGITRTVQY